METRAEHTELRASDIPLGTSALKGRVAQQDSTPSHPMGHAALLPGATLCPHPLPSSSHDFLAKFTSL